MEFLRSLKSLLSHRADPSLPPEPTHIFPLWHKGNISGQATSELSQWEWGGCDLWSTLLFVLIDTGWQGGGDELQQEHMLRPDSLIEGSIHQWTTHTSVYLVAQTLWLWKAKNWMTVIFMLHAWGRWLLTCGLWWWFWTLVSPTRHSCSEVLFYAELLDCSSFLRNM